MHLQKSPFACLATRLASALIVVSCVTSRAADPAFVGILALAAEDDVARQLGLTDEVRQKLRTVVARRESEAVNFVLQIKDLPPEERTRRLAPFVAESERLGMELLTVTQRSLLHQLRVRRLGMIALAEPDIAQLLELTEDQKQAVERLMAERSAALTRGGDRERSATVANYERKLRLVLSDTQRANWERAAGLGASTAQPAAATASVPPATVAAQPDAEPAETNQADAAMKPEPAPAATPEVKTEPAPAATPEVKPEPAPAAVPEVNAEPGPAPTPETKAEPAAGPEAPDQAQMPAEPAADVAQPAESPTEPVSPSDTGTAPQPDSRAADGVVDPENVRLRFSFRYQPWGDVLDWLAENADLSLQSEVVPDGTFNYSDTREYTPTEAIDLINGMLLTRGYTLVRRGRLLTVIDLENPIPDPLVEFVPPEGLDKRGEFELVKTVFHLAKMEPADAEAELGPLLGPGRTMVIMPKARQILVTETAGKLRMIRDVIERAENPRAGEDLAITEVMLKYVTAEEILQMARPHLGLQNAATVGEDISISVDISGMRMYVSGSEDKLKKLRDLVTRLDVERQSNPSQLALEQPQLLTHAIGKANPEQTLAVLQTLLAGLPDVRMHLDSDTKKIVALARPSEHNTIQETIRQLEGEALVFEIIQLRRIDPQLAIATIAKFFPAAAGGEGSEVVVDADPTTMKLYIRATMSNIGQVRDLIAKLESPTEGGSSGSTLRHIPLTGGQAASAVATAQRLWSGNNQIRLNVPADSGPSLFNLRHITPEGDVAPGVPNGDEPTEQPLQPPAKAAPTSTNPPAAAPPGEKSDDKFTLREYPVSARFVAFLGGNDPGAAAEPVAAPEAPRSQTPPAQTPPAQTPPAQAPPAQAPPATSPPDTSGKGSDIMVEVTPNGILIASQDVEALDKFEDLLRTISPPIGPSNRTYTVYFLKYCKADVAQQLIQEILGGTSSAGGGAGGSLIGDVASNLLGGGGGILGALLGGGGAGGGGGGVTTVQATGVVSIVADARLNCLVVQAMPVDLPLIEEMLKVIDREGSITEVETAGRPRVIPIIYVPAEEVASVIREAYSNRLATNAQARGGQPNPVELIRALRGGGRGGQGTEAKSEEAKMTVAVDARSNSLIVTAPEPLFQEVEALVQVIDQTTAGQTEEVSVVSLDGSNAEAVQRALQAIMGASGSRTTRGSSSSRPTTTGSPFGGAPSAGDIQSRLEFIQRLRDLGGGGMMQPGGGGGPPSMGGFRGMQGGPGGSSRGDSGRGRPGGSSRGR
ncbi:MAG: hypothetical protein FJ276_08805 [Planctomycetes bacterium]|nr:hypothetical protein [Planctomycetota bacterium]